MAHFFCQFFLSKIPGPAVLLPFVCLSLGGCSATSETFDCEAGKGVGCKSISTVNRMVDQGKLGSEEEGEGKQTSERPSPLPVISTASFPQQPEVPLSGEFFVQRIQEEHLRVWIAPFQDAQGNFHEGSIVHTVLKPGYWQVSGPGAADQPVLNSRVGDPPVDNTQVNLSQEDQ